MSKLGWTEGKNITIEYRFAEQRNQRLPELAADLLRLKVDLIVDYREAIGIGGEESDYSHSHRDGDRWGPRRFRSHCKSSATGRQCHRTFGSIERAKHQKVGNTQGRSSQARPSWIFASGGRIRPQIKDLRPAASALKVKLEEIETQVDAKGLESAFQTVKKKKVNGIMTMTDRKFLAERKRIVEIAGKYRFPAIYFQKEFVDEGGLMSYGADYKDLYRRAAGYVDKILRGAELADLPVQQATKFEFIINLKAAKQIELTIPVRVLEIANQVIR